MKTKSIKKTALLLLTISIISLFGCNSEKYNYTAVEPDYSALAEESIMHIGAWVAPPPAQTEDDVDYCTQEAYNDIAASGLNNIVGFYEQSGIVKDGKDATERALEYAENAGITMYICDWSFGAEGSVFLQDDNAIKAMLGKYEKYSSFSGILVRDEPKISEFETLSDIVEGVKRYYPNKAGFINLNPIIQQAGYLGLKEGENYKEHYVRKFIEVVKPEVLSFCNYPMLIDGWGEPSIQSMFLVNLESCADEAKRANIPFWSFIQAMSYNRSTRDTDEFDIRYQVLCSMAYGIKGMNYFSYWTLTNNPNDVVPGKAAMLSSTGEKSHSYYDVQKVNREILAMDHVYLNYDWQGTMNFTGEGQEKCKCFKLLQNPLKEHERIKNVKTSEDLLIGAFKDKEGNDAFMVVNFADPALRKNSSVEITLKGTSKAVCYIKGERKEVEAKNGKLKLDIEYGSGAFVVPLA